MKKKILYIDMDGVVADFDADVHLLGKRDAEGSDSETPQGYFLNLKVIAGAEQALHELASFYDLYFLSTPQWSNIHSWSEKRQWVEKHFGELMFKRLILTHNKSLLKGDYLVDDNIRNGVDGFEGEHIHFGTKKFPNWNAVKFYLLNKWIEEHIETLVNKTVGSVLRTRPWDYKKYEYE